MDTKLLKILEEEVSKAKAKKKKKPFLKIRKEKRLAYYSGWYKDKPLTEEKTEKQIKLG